METYRAILGSLGMNPDVPTQRISHNSDNEVRIIDLDTVLKIYAANVPAAIAVKEAAVCRTLNQSLPTPLVVATGTDSSSGRSYLLTGLLPGQHLGAYWDQLRPNERTELARQLGYLLGRIHTDNNQALRWILAPRPPLKVRVGRILADLTVDDLLPADQITRIRAYLAQQLPDNTLPPSLLHGCYRLTNIIGQGTRITGIVDWEDAYLGDPREELALTLYRTIPSAQRLAFINGYHDAAPFGVTDSMMRAYALLYYLTYLPEIPTWHNLPGKQAYYEAETIRILEGTVGSEG